MTVRITTADGGERLVLKVAGRLQVGDVSELNKEIQTVDGQFVLDLSELLSADKIGIEKLRELLSGGAELHGASPYVQLLLDAKT